MQHSAPGPVRMSIAVRPRSDRFGVDSFYRDFVAGMEDRLGPDGGTALLRIVEDEQEEIADYRRWAADGRIDGVVIVDFVEDDPRVPLVEELGLPAILLGGGRRLPTIDVDNARAMSDAVAYLVGLGHRRIGRVGGPRHLIHTAARTQAFDSALAAQGATGVSVEGDYSAESGRTATLALLADADRPTAILYDDATMAVAGVEAARAEGIRIPGELSLLAWDDSAECQLSDPPLSAMDRDVRSLGSAAAGALLEVIEGRTVAVVKARDAIVVERGSTAPPAS
ncbi:LacI family DNA-binding transcriptional regulator [Leifsonia sp. SIMBA_070]|uniref:LacI family DNA-binding transcriptional regulator n=1 Tax=Leifsonia sp. SIMBA_070 TaxID=3085810 RepID=UPI00397888EB